MVWPIRAWLGLTQYEEAAALAGGALPPSLVVEGVLASSPGFREEGGRPGIHCMRMRNDFRTIYRTSKSKSVRTPIRTTC